MNFEWSSDVSQGAWIRPRLLPWTFPMVVGSTIPTEFPAYCRILHPAYGEPARRVRWHEMASWAKTRLTPHAQYGYVALPEHVPALPCPADNGDPMVGDMDHEDFEALVQIVSRHAEIDTWWGIWDGHGWDHAVSIVIDTGARHRVPDPVPASIRQGPRLCLPGRDYLMVHGSAEGALDFTHAFRQTPNLWWAADHSWCVATEIDFCYTYVGGPPALIQNILASKTLRRCRYTSRTPLFRQSPHG